MNYLQKAIHWLGQKASVEWNTAKHNEWLSRNGYAVYGNYTNVAGATVNAETALGATAIYAGVKILAEDMGNLPFFVYERSLDGKSVHKARKHWTFERLHGMANPDMASGEFVECLTARAVLLGDGFAWPEPIGDTGNHWLWPWDNDDVRVSAQSGRRTMYEFRDVPGARTEWTPLRTDQVFHLRGFTFNGRKGDDLLNRARHMIGITLASQEFAGSFLKNDVSAGVWLEHPGNPGPEGVKNIKAAYEEKKGSSKAGEINVLREGMRARRLDPDMQKMQLLEVRKFQVVEAARILRMPPHKLGDHEKLKLQ